MMSAADMEIMRLREEIEILQEENRQLKEGNKRQDILNTDSQMRLLGIRPSGVTILKMLMTGRVATHDAIIREMYDMDEPDNARNIISIQIMHLRRSLKEIGVSIENIHGVGYRMSEADIKKVSDLLSGAG